jgi:hypothetical protein
MSDEGTPFEGALGRPEHGARIVVRLMPGDPENAAYDVTLSIAELTWQGSAVVRGVDGQVEQGPWAPLDPPSWLTQAAHTLLRSAWQRRRAGNAWPRRLARWRPSPEAASEA